MITNGCGYSPARKTADPDVQKKGCIKHTHPVLDTPKYRENAFDTGVGRGHAKSCALCHKENGIWVFGKMGCQSVMGQPCQGQAARDVQYFWFKVQRMKTFWCDMQTTLTARA